MKQKNIILLFFLLCSAFMLHAQTDSISYANQLYAEGDYNLAALQYEEILRNKGVAPELYYNLGNAYYKLDETAKAILNYERALRLKPNYPDAEHNLELAQLKIVDYIPDNGSFFLMRWVNDFVKIFTSNQWLFTSVLLFIATIILTFLFIFGSSIRLRKTSFYLAILFIIMSVIAFIFSGMQKKQLENRNQAIIMSGVVTVKSSPDKSGTDLFQLHEGTKIEVKSDFGGWAEIIVGNGNIGWIELLHIEKI